MFAEDAPALAPAFRRTCSSFRARGSGFRLGRRATCGAAATGSCWCWRDQRHRCERCLQAGWNRWALTPVFDYSLRASSPPYRPRNRAVHCFSLYLFLRVVLLAGKLWLDVQATQVQDKREHLKKRARQAGPEKPAQTSKLCAIGSEAFVTSATCGTLSYNLTVADFWDCDPAYRPASPGLSGVALGCVGRPILIGRSDRNSRRI